MFLMNRIDQKKYH